MNEVNKSVDRIELLHPFVGKWVMLSPDETKVISSGDSFQEVLQNAKGRYTKENVVTLVPPVNEGMIL